MEFKEKLHAYRILVETAIDEWLPKAATRPPRIHEAMRYSLSAGGKRLRPVLALAVCNLFGKIEKAIPAAIAIECLHTYSLIHDDLPSIDDGDLRRGQPACHMQFDEATAILTGDALLTFAFQLLSRHYQEDPKMGLELVSTLSEAAGSQRLIGGQMEDILGESKPLDEDGLNFIHHNKTSALFEASIRMGASIGKADESDINRLDEYGRSVGMAFQVVDDILDATSDERILGKTTGRDSALGKTTYTSLFGLEESRLIADELTGKAIQASLSLSVEAPFLSDLAKHLAQRIA